MTSQRNLPPAWAVLQLALAAKKPVRARHHNHDRVLCPHALGWKNGRAKLMAYQSGGTTSDGPLPADPAARWRCMFVDDVEAPLIVDEPWETWDNHSQSSSCMDQPPEHEVNY